MGLDWRALTTGIGLAAGEERQRSHQEELQYHALEYQTLVHLADEAGPTYRDAALSHLLAYTAAPAGSKGDKDRQGASSAIYRLLAGTSPQTQYTKTQFEGGPSYQTNYGLPEMSGPSTASGSNMFALLKSPQLNGQQGAQPVDPSLMRMYRGGQTANDPAYQLSPMSDESRIQQALGLPGGDLQATANMQSQGGVAQMQRPNAQQVMTQTGERPGFTARAKIPFTEDAVAREVRRAEALAPIQKDIYGYKTDATTASKILINQSRAVADLTKSLNLLDARTKAQAGRDILKEAYAIGDPNDPGVMELARQRVEADYQQRREFHDQRVTKMQEDIKLAREKFEEAQRQFEETLKDRQSGRALSADLRRQITERQAKQRGIGSRLAAAEGTLKTVLGNVAYTIDPALKAKADTLEKEIASLKEESEKAAAPIGSTTPAAPSSKSKVEVGSILEQDGKRYRVTGFDEQGRPKGKLIK